MKLPRILIDLCAGASQATITARLRALRLVARERRSALRGQDNRKYESQNREHGSPPDEWHEAEVEDAEWHKDSSRRDAILAPVGHVFREPGAKVLFKASLL